jgi:hypothetical protein
MNTNNYAELTDLFIDKHSAVSKKQGYLLKNAINNLKAVSQVSTLFLKERKVPEWHPAVCHHKNRPFIINKNLPALLTHRAVL